MQELIAARLNQYREALDKARSKLTRTKNAGVATHFNLNNCLLTKLANKLTLMLCNLAIMAPCHMFYISYLYLAYVCTI